MKKVYTITFHHAHNYGAMLQAYALQSTVSSLGWKNEILDFSQDKVELFRLYRKNQSFKQEVVKYDLLTLMHYRENKKRFDLMEEFYRNYLKKTEQIKSISQLKRFPFESANFLVGSDQMWNFKGMKKIPEYIALPFIKNEIYYNTYAVSMGGCYRYTHQLNTDFRTLLSRVRKISVREASMKDFLEKTYNIKSVVVEDPVFLLKFNEWEKLAENRNIQQIPSKYILCFELVPHIDFQNVIDSLKRQYNLPVVVLTMAINSTLKAEYVIRAAGPKEFIYLIKNADAVISTSFHCAAFSIIFHKPIYSLLTTHAPTRIVELLETYGLEKGLINNGKATKYLVEPNQWDLIDNKIFNGRTFSIDYLKSLERYFE